MAYGFQIRTTAGFVDLGDIRAPRRVFEKVVVPADHTRSQYGFWGSYTPPAARNFTKANCVITFDALDGKAAPHFIIWENASVSWHCKLDRSDNFRISYWQFY